MKRITIYSRIFRWDNHVLLAIDSILKQTYKNYIYYIEVNEFTYNKLNSIQAKNSNIILMLTDNINVGFVKNSINICENSDYICTFDGDDILAPDFLETQINFMEENQLDISCCAVDFVNEHGKKIGERKLSDQNIIYMKRQFLDAFPYYFQFMRPIWGKVFRTSLFEKNMWNDFPTSDTYGGYGGDTKTSLELLKRANRIGIHHKVGYYYTIWSKSASYTLSKGRENADKFLLDMLVDFHKNYTDNILAKSYHFIYLVYFNGLIDTINLLMKTSLDFREKVEKFIILFKLYDVSPAIKFVSNAKLNGQGTLAKLKNMVTQFICLYSFDGYANEFSYCLNILMQLSDNIILGFIVRNAPSTNFLIKNKKLINYILQEDDKNTIDYIALKLNENDTDNFFLIDILLNVSAKIESEELFIQSKIIKSNLLKDLGDELGARKIIDELFEIGVVLEE